VHGVCPEPATVTKERIETYVIEQFLQGFPNLAIHQSPDETDSDVLAEAVAAEQAYRAQLDNLELRTTIGDVDHDRLIATLHRQWQEKLAAVSDVPTPSPLPEGMSLEGLVSTLQAEGRTEELRELLGSGIEAVFVRTAASRRRDLPIADRVKIVWRGDVTLDLPRRGQRFEPRRVTW